LPTKQVLDRVGEVFRQDLRVQWRARGAAAANHSRISADYGCKSDQGGRCCTRRGLRGSLAWSAEARRGGNGEGPDLCARS